MQSSMGESIQLYKTDVSTLLCQLQKLDLSKGNTTECDISYQNISAKFLEDGLELTSRFYRDFVLLVYLKVALENTLEVFTTLKDTEIREGFDRNHLIKIFVAIMALFVIFACIIYNSYTRYRRRRKSIKLHSCPEYIKANKEDTESNLEFLDAQNISPASDMENFLQSQNERSHAERPHVLTMRSLSVEESTSSL